MASLLHWNWATPIWYNEMILV